MTGTRIVLLLLAASVAAPAVALGDNPLFNRKGRIDQTRVRFLAELLRTETDETKRQAAVVELSDADPRVIPEVIPALVAALKKDTAAVRASAAEVLGRFKTVFPVAGAALESVADSDATPSVRDAARQALWEYHLNGYRSSRGTPAVVTQTAEPPIARPSPPRPPVPVATPRPPVVATVATAPVPVLPAVAAPPPEVAPVGPRVLPLPGLKGPRTILTSATRAPRSTTEPPVAKPAEPPPPVAPVEAVPVAAVRPPEPVVFGRAPRILFELPEVVPHPGAIPGVTPFPEPTPEPPLSSKGAPGTRG